MNKAIKDKAKYVVLAKAGTDHSEEHSAVIAWFLRMIYVIKAHYWLWRVNRMSEGEILVMYYALTRKEGESDVDVIRRTIADTYGQASE